MEAKQKKEYAKIIILSILMLTLLISIIFSNSISNNLEKVLYKADFRVNKDDMVVHFINVGQGDAIAIRFPNEEVMLIDAGTKNSQNNLVEYIKTNVISSNKHLTIDYLILTHPDADHSGGMSAIFEEFNIIKFFRPNVASISEDEVEFATKSSTDEYDQVIKKSNNEKGLVIEIVKQNDKFNIGSVEVTIFAPLKNYSTTNSMSPIIKIEYLNKSFLFCGDIQLDAETDMLNAYGIQLDADVLKVAHHGSSNSTSAGFVQVVSPEYSIICVGNNSYGHPKFEVVQRLQNAGSKVYTTNDKDLRFVCGEDMFGLLNDTQFHSFEYTDWWIIALSLIMILLIMLLIVLVRIIRIKEQSKIN